MTTEADKAAQAAQDVIDHFTRLKEAVEHIGVYSDDDIDRMNGITKALVTSYETAASMAVLEYDAEQDRRNLEEAGK